jgi:alanine dehydrogenase
MLVLNRREVSELLDLDRLVDALAEAMAAASAGATSMPPRMAAVVAERNAFLAAMPAFLPSAPTLAVKLVTLFPGNAAAQLPTHQAVVLVFDPATGTPLALMDGTYITATRTAAASALATRLLARPDAAVLAVLGTGVQARSHARALVRVRPIQEVRLAGRHPERTRALVEELSNELGAVVRGAASYEEALAGADVVAAATHSPDPVVRRSWLAPGVHVNSVGFVREGREVDGETVRDALVVVETRAAALAPYPSGSNDLLWPIRDGLIGAEHVHAEVGELVAGTRPGRTAPDQITLYKSVGVAVQDAAAAALILKGARERGAGREVEL